MKKFLIILLAGTGLTLLISCTSGGSQTPTASTGAQTTAGQSAVVDDVSQKDIVKVAASSEKHTTLVKAIQAADLVDALSNAGPFTVFAPVNEAFDKLPAGTLDNLLKPENKNALRDILQYHVTVSVLDTSKLHDGQILGEVNGENATVHVQNGKYSINDANIIGSVRASNGIIHIVDKVLFLPKNNLSYKNLKL